MSYDLDVFGSVSLSPRELAKIAAPPGMRLKRALGWGVKDVRALDSSGEVAFSVEGPMRVERDDLPLVVARTLPGSTCVYHVRVPYDVKSVGDEFRAEPNDHHLGAAKEYAEDLATAVGGQVVDPQVISSPEDEEADPSRRTAEKLYVHLRWFRRFGELADATALAERYLQAVRESFPLAVPVRFGSHEPFQGRLPRDGGAAFDALYRAECRADSLAMTSKDFISASISPWTPIGGDYQTISIDFDLDHLVESDALGAVEGFLVDVARRVGSFFAFAELNDTRFATARPRGFDGAWGGLPVDPQWATWYDAEYSTLVRPRLRGGEIQEFPEGLMHRWSTTPARADAIRRGLSTTWPPPDLVGAVHTTPGGPRGIAQAKVVPESLRVPSS